MIRYRFLRPATPIALSLVSSLVAVAVPAAAQTPPGKPSDAFVKDMNAYLQDEGNMDQLATAITNHFRKKQAMQQKEQEEQEKKSQDAQFENPTKIDITGSPVIGNASAKVTIVEFSDFQCPFCSRGASVMKEVLKSYPNDVKVVFKNLPLDFHPNAVPAAKAALAAGEQGKFWEMHDLLFQNQKALTAENFAAFAKQLGLNETKFKADMESETVKKKIEADKALAKSLGINGTPGFYVNGVQVQGAQPAENFKKIIDKWLAKLGGGAKS